MIVKILLLAFSVLIFALLAFKVIDTNIFEWQNGAFALGFASMFPWAI